MKKVFWILTILIFLLGCIFIYQNIIYNDKKLHIIVCDVGQGDAILIRTPQNSDILIDGGPDSSVLNCLSKHMPFWDRTIEIMVLTHPHSDHITGLIDVAKRYSVKYFGTENFASLTPAYDALLKQLKRHGIVPRYLWQGDQFVLKDGVILKTLWPTREWGKGEQKGENENGFSAIQLLTYKHFKALFTADAQAEDLERLIESFDFAQDFRTLSVLKVPHHGSKFGLNQNIVNALMPELAVISVGKNNYGHPSALILELLKNIKTLRTDQMGGIEITSDGDSFKVRYWH